MKNISLFFVGIILIVFAGFFHLYRYALNQAKNPPPPPPHEDKPELVESQVSSSKLSEGHSSDIGTKELKEIATQISTPKIQADLGVGASMSSDFGSSDLKKP